MSEASSMKFSVEVPGSNSNQEIRKLLTLESVIEWIKLHELDEYTTKGLIALASRYPNNALPLFKKNFQIMLQRVRSDRKKEGFINDTNKSEEESSKERFEEFSSIEEGLNAEWGSGENKNNSESL